MISLQDLAKQPKDYNTMVARKTGSTLNKVEGVVINKKSGKGYNVVISMDTEEMQPNSMLKVYCNCDDFKFRWAYVLDQKDALLFPSKFRLDPPKSTNPDQVMNACKHIHTFIKSESDKGLKTFSKRKGSL